MKVYHVEKVKELVSKIRASAGTEEEIDAWVDELEKLVPHPAITDVLFGYEGYSEDYEDDEVVDILISYQPLRL